MKKITYFWRNGLWALLSLSFLLIVCASLIYLYLASQLPNVDSLKAVKLQVPLRIYTQDGLLIQEYGEKKRIPLNYEEIPKALIQAVLATEDQRFFEHPGVDILGLARATVSMIQTGSKSQGGSTITMQVARNFFLYRKKTFLRKFNEIMLAIKIDRELSKEKILELYLNKIYLGNRAYGVGAAAQFYYGKPLNELSLAQLAMIAGLPQAPSTQNPIANPIAALKRRDHVLERMWEGKYITKEQYTQAIQEPMTEKSHGATIQVKAPYVAEMIRQSLYDNFGPNAYSKGYKVYTTIQGQSQIAANQAVEENLLAYGRRHGYRGPVAHLDMKSYASEDALRGMLVKYPVVNDLEPALILSLKGKEAQAQTREDIITIPWEGLAWAKPALKKGFVGRAPSNASQVLAVGDVVYVRQRNNQWELTQIPDVESALVAINPHNGAIKALVGGFNFEKSKFNRATQSGRQPGSTFKPFIYAAALNHGYSLATLVNDAPIVIDDPSQTHLWRPHNHNLKFNGPTRLKEALIYSRNLVSIRVLDDIGIDYAVDFLSHFGFRKENLPHSLSLALGSLSISPLELTSAYAVFANGGYKIEPYIIYKITDNDGNVLLQAKPSTVCNPSLESCDPDSKSIESLAPRVLPEDIAFLMNSALQGVVQRGTGKAARVLNRKDIAGKTGTTNDQVDAWFSGYTPNLVATAWIGFDTPHPLHEYAAGLALPMWIDFMKNALTGLPEQGLKQPDNVVAVPINPQTGQQTPPDFPNAVMEYFRQNEIPGNEEIVSTADNTETVAVQENLF